MKDDTSIFGAKPDRLDKLVFHALEQTDEEDRATPTASLDAILERHGGQIGHYKLLSVLGEGGMGVVHLAEQQQPIRRHVALKIIKPGMDSKRVVARFEAERQALALFDHPNIAHVYDAGTTETGRPYFVMEYIKGLSITEHCDRYKLTIDDRLQLFLKVCHAVQYAHQKGIIHRDIKPSNILISTLEDEAVPKIIDFGVAKALAQPLTEQTLVTEHGQLFGTPEYMSPEQADEANEDIDTRSDIYSLGVLLYELLTGTTPFGEEKLHKAGYIEMQRIIREQEPTRPSTKLSSLGEKLANVAKHRSVTPDFLRKTLRGDLDWIVMKSLEKNRNRRYETANGFALDIRHHLDNQPVVARPPSKLYRFKKMVRRNKVIFVSAGAVAAALLLGTIISTILALRAIRAERDAIDSQISETRMRRAAQTREQTWRRWAYASDMNLIQQHLTNNRIGLARAILNRQRSQFDQQDLRGWEWRYLWGQCQSDALTTLCKKSDQIHSLAVSYDGRWLAVNERNHPLWVWDLQTQQEIPVPSMTNPRFRCMAFSPTDPALACSFHYGDPYEPLESDRFGVRLWNPETRKWIGDLPHSSFCAGIVFSEDGKRLVSYTRFPMETIMLWDLSNAKSIKEIRIESKPAGNWQPGMSIAANSDLTLVAVRQRDGYVSIVNLTTGNVQWSQKLSDDDILSLALSKDGSTLAAGEGIVKGDIHLLDTESGRSLGRLEGHRAWVSSLIFLPGDRQIVSASADQTIRLWDIATLTETGMFRGHEIEIWSLALFPDGSRLATGDKYGSVCLWNLNSQRPYESYTIPLESITGWHFFDGGRAIVALDFEGRLIKLQGHHYGDRTVMTAFDISDFLAKWHFGDPRKFYGCFSNDAQLLAMPVSEDIIDIFDVGKSRVVQRLHTPGWRRPLAILPEETRLILFDPNTGNVERWDLSSEKMTDRWQGAKAWTHAVSPDGRWYVAVDPNGLCSVCNMNNGKTRQIKLDFDIPIDVAFSPDGKYFSVCSYRQGYATLREIATLDEVTKFGDFNQGVSSVAFSYNRSRFAAASGRFESIKLWDLNGFQELITLHTDVSRFLHLSFSPDGNALGAVGDNGNLYIWQAPTWETINASDKTDKFEKTLSGLH